MNTIINDSVVKNCVLFYQNFDYFLGRNSTEECTNSVDFRVAKSEKFVQIIFIELLVWSDFRNVFLGL